MEERLQKILARAGLGSRRACEAMIAEGRVTVNGRMATLGQKADPRRDEIAVDGARLGRPERLRYVMLHKPRGAVSSLEAQGDRPTVRDLVPLEERLYPVGRLDVDSEGLIVLTNDGELTDHLTHPRYESEKEYRVLVKGDPDAERLAAWRRGVVLEGTRTAPARVEREESTAAGTWLRVTMHEGRKHQIRDIGQLLGLPVRRLVRVRMGGLTLGRLAPGEWRELRPDEVRRLREPGGPAPRDPRPNPRRMRGTAGGQRPASKRPAAAGRRATPKRRGEPTSRRRPKPGSTGSRTR
jgi:23S rRNA pseudouridine2605 synthase